MNPLILLAAGVAVIMFLGAGFALLVGGNRQVDQRVQDFVTGYDTEYFDPDEEVVVASGPGLSDRLDERLSRRDFFARIKKRIAMADVKLRVSEYIGLQLLAAVVVGLAARIFFGGPILPIVGILIGLRLPRMYISFMANRRLHAFEDQLADTLGLWVNALRSGYSVLQGMEAIATELPPPVSKEFERVVQEVRLGLSLEQALANLLRRMPSDDLDLIVTAVNIQREVGGNLAEILDIISHTIRERVRIKGEIRTLTAQGRLTGWVISLLPVGLALILYSINPEYGGQLLRQEDPFLFTGFPCGWLVIGVGLIMMGFGVMAIRRIVDIEI